MRVLVLYELVEQVSDLAPKVLDVEAALRSGRVLVSKCVEREARLHEVLASDDVILA